MKRQSATTSQILQPTRPVAAQRTTRSQRQPAARDSSGAARLAPPKPDEGGPPPSSTLRAPSSQGKRRRNGFVAQLPKSVRDQVNRLLLDGLTYANVIKQIGEPVKNLHRDQPERPKASQSDLKNETPLVELEWPPDRSLFGVKRTSVLLAGPVFGTRTKIGTSVE